MSEKIQPSNITISWNCRQ